MLISKLNACFRPRFPAVLNCYNRSFLNFMPEGLKGGA